MRFSICILSYNAQATIEECVVSCINQNFQPYEILISDDCSNDNTIDILRNLTSSNKQENIKIFSQGKNLGIPKNTNFLINKASGDILFFIAGDDYINRDFLQSYHKIIPNNDTDNIFCISESHYELIDGDLIKNTGSYSFKNSFLYNAIRKRASFIKCGVSRKILFNSKYPGNLGHWADWYWDVNIAVKNPNVKVIFNKETAYIHRNGSGISSRVSPKEIFESYLITALSILNDNKKALSFFDRKYLLLEIYSTKYILERSCKDFCIFLMLFAINLNNFTSAAQVKGFLLKTIKKWI